MSVTKSLKPGVSRFTRSQTYARRKLFSKKKATAAPMKVEKPTTKTVPVKGDKNGKTRVVPVVKAPKYYPADDVPVKKVTRKVHYPQKLRSSIVPGTILVLLSGRFAGKRVVFLKQLDSGLLLVTGPHKINGVPLRRVNQAYVLATSTKITLDLKNLEKFNDDYFKKQKESKKEATEQVLFNEQTPKVVDAHRIADQKAVDASILSAVKKVPQLKAYLNASFVLTKGQFPHMMKF